MPELYAKVGVVVGEMQKKLSEIVNTPYGQDNVSCEPSKEDIRKAIDDKDFETRGFQSPEVKAEYWALNVPERYEWIKSYHAKRIAFHVVNGWQERIVLNEDKKTIKDGLHRLKAAIFLGWDTVEIED